MWQSGFNPESSTVCQLVELYHEFSRAVSEDKEIRVVLCDSPKAFDCVWHKGLLFKLQQNSINGALLEWIRNYLKDRKQRVVINGQNSEWGHIRAGVPQGSIPGPLLVLIFINDITHVVIHCKIRLFAGDTCLFIEINNNIAEAGQLLNEDLAAIKDWSLKWLVKFSPEKTESMLLSNKSRPQDHPVWLFNDIQIANAEEHKHLRVTLASDLTWISHINTIQTRANQILGLIDRLSKDFIFLGFYLFYPI